MTSNEEELWHKVCENCGIEKSVTTQWLNKIREKYDNESERVYHNSQILRSKCEHIVEVDEAGDIALADALVFAIFFQYYFFDVKSDCGDRNREAFRSFCAEANVTDEKLVQTVLQLLGDPSINVDGIDQIVAFYQDLDLIVLGFVPDEYQLYKEHIQKEFNHLDNESYKTMRLRILETFLTIPQIYSIDFIRNKYEDAARANIKQEIAELKSKLN